MKVPTYSLSNFSNQAQSTLFKVEVFDHNRHYRVEYPHRHDSFYEILYIKSGSGHYQIDHKNFEIAPYTIFFVSPGQVHDIHFSKDILGYLFLFTEDFFAISNDTQLLDLFENMWYQNEALLIEATDVRLKLEWLFRAAIDEFKLQHAFSSKMCYHYLANILNYCAAMPTAQSHEIYQNKKGATLVKKFRNLIQKHTHQNLSVAEYAHMLSVTPNYLNDIVKKNTGLTAHQIIFNRLLVEIKRELLYMDKDIGEIAFAFNFKDQSYFTRFFKQHVGITPKEFREKSVKSTKN